MYNFWRTKREATLFKKAFYNLISTIWSDLLTSICNLPKSVLRKIKYINNSTGNKVNNNLASFQFDECWGSFISATNLEVDKPIIFASMCHNKMEKGARKYNGGVKELNNIVKLLRLKGYEAYMVSYDGEYEPWLIEHQPHISIAQFKELLTKTSNIRCVTSWIDADEFIRLCPAIYYWDMELAYTANWQVPKLARLYARKIVNTAGITRTIQAWHMTAFRKPCVVIPNMVDNHSWSPLAPVRMNNRVGYMHEGPHTDAYIRHIQELVQTRHLAVEFYKISGNEQEVLHSMRTCTFFLTMNTGKDEFWGEGGPLPPLEAMATGCIPITFDIIGPWEIIQHNYTGIIVPNQRPDLMADALLNLLTDDSKTSFIRNNILSVFKNCHTLEARWPFVKQFLHLADGNCIPDAAPDFTIAHETAG